MTNFLKKLLKKPAAKLFPESFNRWAINDIVGRVRTRPHPYSTAYSFVSWKGLFDRTWSARHLPEEEIGNLPDVEKVLELFDRRTDPERKQQECAKSTCLFPAFAQYLTDGFIRTDPNCPKKTTSNHVIDLCQLYGLNEKQTQALRDKDGKLKSQCIEGEKFAPYLFQHNNGELKVKPEFNDLELPLGLGELLRACGIEDDEIKNIETPRDLEKLLNDAYKKGGEETITKLRHLFAFGGNRVNTVPQTAMINTLFLREHNRLARKLKSKYEKEWKRELKSKCGNDRKSDDWIDNRIGDRIFETARNIVIVEFIKIVVEEYINHISPIKFELKADPTVAWKAHWNKPNWITVEFGLLYRWHSLVPDSIEWGGTPYDVEERRLNNKLLIQTGLAKSFVEMSKQAAGKLGPFNTTERLLEEVEKKSIELGRKCCVAPFSKYREYLGEKSPESMADISSNPKVQEILKKLYEKPEDVEFFVGLFVEDQERNSPLPRTILKFVGIDAFSQALTNPLLSEHVYKEETFTPYGWDQIKKTATLKDILCRNMGEQKCLGNNDTVSMTRDEWKWKSK